MGSELYERLGPLYETVKGVVIEVFKLVTAQSSSKGAGAMIKEESEKLTAIEGLGISMYAIPASGPFHRDNAQNAYSTPSPQII